MLEKPKSELLLKYKCTVTTPATGKFVVRKWFVKNTRKNARLKIVFVSTYFRTRFGDMIEEPTGEAELHCHILGKAAEKLFADRLILSEFDGKESVVTSLAKVFSLIKRQGNGEKGALLTNGQKNIFYTPDVEGVVQAIDVFWVVDEFGPDGWYVHARSVEYPGRWHAGDWVFSRSRLAAES